MDENGGSSNPGASITIIYDNENDGENNVGINDGDDNDLTMLMSRQ